MQRIFPRLVHICPAIRPGPEYEAVKRTRLQSSSESSREIAEALPCADLYSTYSTAAKTCTQEAQQISDVLPYCQRRKASGETVTVWKNSKLNALHNFQHSLLVFKSPLLARAIHQQQDRRWNDSIGVLLIDSRNMPTRQSHE